ncbi:MAG: hypothetical protein UW88_C0002G0085 [Candidatus Collierbacteria bacterium GW2011_GWD2_45_10]|nr:MAG: hypothetical protein UW31_C0005G0121 [Candidatus Collierbacteria bacterium GW2011_GWA2_44_13]KKT63062.1 MAG: hypothetical protein UW56_C0002G0047 [Candidatus Collierbacteria bacterium GW2011_GWD1_44_27]KKT66423.1 MAG: hypothetical protein UW58_C0008G0016 [Candidatus Collierbacteria bacterium GW2011_GWC2_44_30]KKT89554.1 MAG: hypothetical protein UW88_C0002G0085 [Candidatus Collierbacteria bacterium GW2011_GWD2_45_10]
MKVVWPISKAVDLEKTVREICKVFVEQFPGARLNNIVHTGNRTVSGLACAALGADKVTSGPVVFSFDETVGENNIELVFIV